jgi:hypothetical protein
MRGLRVAIGLAAVALFVVGVFSAGAFAAGAGTSTGTTTTTATTSGGSNGQCPDWMTQAGVSCLFRVRVLTGRQGVRGVRVTIYRRRAVVARRRTARSGYTRWVSLRQEGYYRVRIGAFKVGRLRFPPHTYGFQSPTSYPDGYTLVFHACTQSACAGG